MGKIGVFSLVMLMSGAIDSIRNLPATALFGTSLVFFFIFSALFFLIPVALISAELSSAWSEKGGVFHWARMALGEKVGFFTVWLQWINTMIWFPTILSFLAGTITYFFSPSLAQNKLYLISVILTSFWLLTLVNLKGLTVSAKFSSVCTVLGMIVPIALIIVLAGIWVIHGYPLQVHFTYSNMIPTFDHSQSWISLTAIMTAFLGIELSTVHIINVKNPQKAFPKALLYSVIAILITMIMGSLAIAIVLPSNQINLVNGVMQAFTNFFKAYHLLWVMPFIALSIIVGTIGNTISWVISPAKGLLQAAQYGFLPDFLSKENKHGVASNLLITQAVLVSVICAAFLLMPSVNGSYWLLTALSTQLYLQVYVVLFIAGIILRYKFPDQPRAFIIPGGKMGLWLISLAGLVGCVITLIVGFIPPDGINIGSVSHYEMLFTSGMFGLMLPVLFFYIYKRVKENANP